MLESLLYAKATVYLRTEGTKSRLVILHYEAPISAQSRTNFYEYEREKI